MRSSLPIACLCLCASGCDLGGLDLGGGPGPGVSSSYEGRRVSVGLDADFELCLGNLARWSADLDRIDNLLLFDREGGRSGLTYLQDEEALLSTCEGLAGCYVQRPEGPLSVESFDALDGRMVPWFVHDRIEYGWSSSLPPFVRVGMAAALAERSCSGGSASLQMVLNRGTVAEFSVSEARATGQWFRLLLEQGGPERLHDFASKLDEGSSEDYVRAVFGEVYGISIDPTWDEAADTPVLPRPGGWCDAPPLPLADGRGEWAETLDCSSPRTVHLADESYGASVRLDLAEASQLTVSGQMVVGASLELSTCACEGTVSTQALELEVPHMLEAGSWELRVYRDEPSSTSFDLELMLEPVSG